MLSNALASIPANLSNETLAPMLKQVMPAVVNLSVRGQLPSIHLPPLAEDMPGFKFTPKFSSLGSGVIVDAKNGYVLTNAHVIKDAKVIIVTLKDGRRLPGKLLGKDEKSDVAVVQIKAKQLEELKFGNSDDLNVGDFVATIGSPFGLNQTATSGVISALNRSDLGLEGYENFIQTDAPINPGNSGGALVNMKGELIGMNTAIIAPSGIGGNVGIGFAIPSNMCKSVLQQIIKYGKVEHSILGVMVQNISPALADAMKLPDSKGALITQVNPDTPAAKAGIKTKDVVISVNGKPVRNAFQIRTMIGLMRPGSEVTLQVRREGKLRAVKAVTISVEKAKKQAESLDKPLLYGLSLKDFDLLDNTQHISGVEVLYVDDYSVAYSSGLRPGDIILSANNQPVTSINKLQEIAKKSPNRLLLKVKQGGILGGDIFLVLEK